MLWLFRFFSSWPLAALHALGGPLGWLVWALSPRYRQQFRSNIAQAGLSFEDARPAIAEAGRFVAELPRLWLGAKGQSCLSNVTVEGHALAVEAFARGKGVIFFGSHSGGFELAPQAFAELYGPITAIYRPARKPWLARLEAIARDRPDLTVLPADLRGIRLMHRALKANQGVAMLIDQVPPEGMGVWAPFFGRPAYTVTLGARLALQTGAVLMPVTCERLPRGRGYVLKFWPAMEGLVGAIDAGKPDMVQAATRMNHMLEAMILSQPGQYLWGYSRYKTPRQVAPPPASPPEYTPEKTSRNAS
jgi:Kdo2-lipid IVA lauroyltransferase/acyltransferase